MNKLSMWISISCLAAMSAGCSLDVDNLSVEERAEIAGATDFHVDTPESLPEAGPSKKLTCGGLLGGQCPPGMKCIDYPGDGCSPNSGGADCLGMCVGKPNGCAANCRPPPAELAKNLESAPVWRAGQSSHTRRLKKRTKESHYSQANIS